MSMKVLNQAVGLQSCTVFASNPDAEPKCPMSDLLDLLRLWHAGECRAFGLRRGSAAVLAQGSEDELE